MTNLEVFRETVKSHGQNLIKGLNKPAPRRGRRRRYPARQDETDTTGL